jgi:site-specific DNA recombinase
MITARAVTIIQPSITRLPQNIISITEKKRVAAYARVSTDNDEQLSSYEAQVDYYTRHIKENDMWEFVEIYTDEGISATNTKKRGGFNRMISDALDGKIDLILTKSVSRFARNTVDSLTTVRKLKEKGVEVYFEKENIYTLDSKGELLITIMSSLAQEESRSISENVTWGQRKRFSDGKVSLPYKQFLGYEKGEDGLPKIVESQAKTVRLLYKLFLEGKTPSGIAKYFTECGIPTPSGKAKWPSSTVESILTNEKYKGDAILQKMFTVDFLSKKMKVNEGEVPQYYVENSHPGIVSPEVFDLAQNEMNRRKAATGHQNGNTCFSSKIICGECGGVYGSKVWHSTSKYRRTIWQCNNKFKGEVPCRMPHLYEDTLKQAFVDAFNSLIENKNEILGVYTAIIRSLTDNMALGSESTALQGECDVVMELIKISVEENAHSTINQSDYMTRYSALHERYEAAKQKLSAVDGELQEREVKRENIYRFLRTLKKNDTLLTEFDKELWHATVDRVIVTSEREITFRFKDGTELPWKI